MRTHSDELDLGAELRALRPAPRAEFTAELDSRVANRLQENRDTSRNAFHRIAEALRHTRPQRFVGLAGAAALLAIAVSTALLSISDREDGSGAPHIAAPGATPHHGNHEFSRTPGAASGKPSESSLEGAPAQAEAAPKGRSTRAGYQLSAAPPNATTSPPGARQHRNVERGAELVLRSGPSQIEADARKVFATVRAARGIVLDSSIHDSKAGAGGNAGEARASFELLIPSARLGDAMATLSRIAPVRSRHESTADITSPTVTARDRLRTSEAKVEALTAQLASAVSEEERIAIEAQLHRERRRTSMLRDRLDRLHGRAHFSRVTLRIEGNSTEGSGPASWGVDDALKDAGHILAIAAGAIVIALAVIAPLAILGLLAWLANRTWVRRRREQTLG